MTVVSGVGFGTGLCGDALVAEHDNATTNRTSSNIQQQRFTNHATPSDTMFLNFTAAAKTCQSVTIKLGA